jgi:hypothetical protein
MSNIQSTGAAVCGQAMESSLVVRRFAIKYDPPTLVVEYKTQSGLFLKKIKIKSKPLVSRGSRGEGA